MRSGVLTPSTPACLRFMESHYFSLLDSAVLTQGQDAEAH